MSSIDKPLTARQLITILVVLGCIAAFVVMYVHGKRSMDHASAVFNCTLAHPALDWNCERFPTGYPTTPTQP